MAAELGVAFVSRHAITLEVVQKVLNVPEIPERRFARQIHTVARKTRGHRRQLLLAYGIGAQGPSIEQVREVISVSDG